MTSADAPSEPPRRPIKRLLIANRGEIATRIISAARELSIETVAIYTSEDNQHTNHATFSAQLESPADFMSIDKLIAVAKKLKVDAVHPGYGFLSESPDFAQRMWEDAGVKVIGPGWKVLARTGDKLSARRLAEEQDVPCLPAMTESTGNVDEVLEFVKSVELPIMLKAVDGGGGRGIKIVRDLSSLPDLAKRAIEESPSKRVFAEKAAVDGFRHIEVQILGDGKGNVRHLWERECSIQRRYQKVVEFAPSSIRDRSFVAQIIDAASRIARSINYLSLGTFEFLANPSTKQFYFLEINPRLQVEHTITEALSNTDIVAAQLAIAQGVPLDSVIPGNLSRDPVQCPPLHSIQLRVTAENVHSNFALSIGKIPTFTLPSGHGVRVDTALVPGRQAVVSADFDSLLAKIIVTASSWPAAVQKARRALEDTSISGVKSNLDALRGIVSSQDFLKERCDTTWLESKVVEIVTRGANTSKEIEKTILKPDLSGTSMQLTGVSNSAVILRRGDAWSLKVQNAGADAKEEQHYLRLTRVMRNELPSALVAEMEYSSPSLSKPLSLRIDAASSSASAASVLSAGKHRRGDANNPKHIIIPFSGKLVEVMVDEGDTVKPEQVICVVQQMKMELEVRSSRSGRVTWLTEVEDGEEVSEGMLAAEVEDDEDTARLSKL